MIAINEILGTEEVQTLRFLKATIAEFLGTGLLVVAGCGSAATVPSNGPQDVFGVAFTFGLAVATAVWLFGHISGAHINPSISIGFLVTGHISILKCVCYVIAQVAGGIAGAGLLLLVLPPGVRGELGSTSLVPGVADWQGFLVELMGTFALVMTVFASCDRLRTDHGGSIALAIGLCVAAQLTWMSNVTGGSVNPARSLGPAIFAGKWKNHWVYWTGPISGGIIAALLYEKVFAVEAKETEPKVHKVKYNNCHTKSNGSVDKVIEIEAPTDNKSSENKPPSVYNIGNNNSDEVLNLEENVDKDQIFLKSFIEMESNKYSSNIEETCVNCENEDEQKEDNISDANLSNL